MGKIKVMVNGIPDNMAVNVAKHAIDDDRFELIPYSLTGQEIDDRFKLIPYSLTGQEIAKDKHSIDCFIAVTLIRPENSEQVIAGIIEKGVDFISVDFTHPSAVNSNAEFYCKHDLPFVMGTTGGDRKLLEETIAQSSIIAVVAPNMAKQIVGFQAMMEYAAKTFPDLFKRYSLEIKESHQSGKADTSGTAKAMIRYFNSLGIPFTEDEIFKERDPQRQLSNLKVPHEYLGGHGWHTYTLVSDDSTVSFEFTHNANGRDVYAKGTLDAISYLHRKINQGGYGVMLTMADVLKDT